MFFAKPSKTLHTDIPAPSLERAQWPTSLPGRLTVNTFGQSAQNDSTPTGYSRFLVTVTMMCHTSGSGSQSVYRLATGWTVRGSNPGGGEIFRTCSDRPWGPPSLLYDGYRVFPGGKERPGRDDYPSPLLVPWSKNSRAILLLPLWAVRPVQSFSACTRVHFTFTFTFVSHKQLNLKINSADTFRNFVCVKCLVRVQQA